MSIYTSRITESTPSLRLPLKIEGWVTADGKHFLVGSPKGSGHAHAAKKTAKVVTSKAGSKVDKALAKSNKQFVKDETKTHNKSKVSKTNSTKTSKTKKVKL